MPEPYEVVAAEYYDSERHPTCANFRQASKSLLQPLVLAAGADASRSLEVGCGNSVLAEILAESGRRLEGLLLTDSSPGMLQYSERWRRWGATLVRADAERLPVASASIDLLVASLGDPYNTPQTWSEFARCVRPLGRVLFTTPSYEWASSYRSAGDYPMGESEFLLRSGVEITLPSIVLPEHDQRALLDAAGFRVASLTRFSVSRFDGVVSPKLVRGSDAVRNVVVAYEAVRIER